MNNSTSKILIVDDNTFYLSLLNTVLKDIGADIYMADSGVKALSLIKENDFALAVLDIQMPEMDGFELATHIRELENTDLLPIIFLTAYFSDEIQMFKGYDYGAIDYLTKPVNKSVFISKVKIFLELDRQKRHLIASKQSLEKSKFELEIQQKELQIRNKELRKAHVEAEKSRKKYTQLYDFAPAGYFIINRNYKILEINIKASGLLLNEPLNLIGHSFKQFVSDEDISVFEDFLSKVFDNHLFPWCEIGLINADNQPVYVYLEGAILGEKQKCLISMIDITDRKKTQIALKESEELYHSLLRTSPDGIIITNKQGIIIEASNIALELLGSKNRLEIEGSHYINYLPKSSRKTLIKIHQEIREKGLVQNVEIVLSRVDKSVFIGEISSTEIKEINGELKAYMAVIRNISERKLLEKQIRHSERMAGIGELATGMAHEINQPLNTISLSIDNIIFAIDNKTLTDTYLKTKINKVFDNISRIKKIIDHVRTFSRDQDDFIQSEFDINQSIKSSISMVSEQMYHKDISLNFLDEVELPKLKGNTHRFEQVMLNLLINAKDALDEKKKKLCKNFKKRIDISAKLINDQIVLEVKDNGNGIKSEDIDKILLPFYTTKAPGFGTGLGLSISYGIIKELNGEIEIQSEISKGTTMRIIIPVNPLNLKH